MTYEALGRSAARAPKQTPAAPAAAKVGSPAPAAKAKAPARASVPAAKAQSGKTALQRGYSTGQSIERDRLREVARFAIGKGHTDEALRLLAETNLSATDINAQLASRNILADNMRARFEGGAR